MNTYYNNDNAHLLTRKRLIIFPNVSFPAVLFFLPLPTITSFLLLISVAKIIILDYYTYQPFQFIECYYYWIDDRIMMPVP